MCGKLSEGTSIGGVLILGVHFYVSSAVELVARSTASKLQGSGIVWESCDRMGKLSKDNRVAAGKVCLAQLRLLRDAQEEAKEVRAGVG